MKNYILIYMLLIWCSCQPRQTSTAGSSTAHTYGQAELYIVNPDGRSAAIYVYSDDTFTLKEQENGSIVVQGDSLTLTMHDPMKLSMLSGLVEQQPVSDLSVISRHVNARFYQKDYDNISMRQTDSSLTINARSEIDHRTMMILFKK